MIRNTCNTDVTLRHSEWFAHCSGPYKIHCVKEKPPTIPSLVSQSEPDQLSLTQLRKHLLQNSVKSPSHA